jgi:hypothetical protein
MSSACTYGDCHHTRYRDRMACQRRLRKERLKDLDLKERLIQEERTALLLEAERDIPMPGHEPDSDDCPACIRLRPFTPEGY